MRRRSRRKQRLTYTSALLLAVIVIVDGGALVKSEKSLEAVRILYYEIQKHKKISAYLKL